MKIQAELQYDGHVLVQGPVDPSTLEGRPPERGEIVIRGEIPGGEVWVDGLLVGTVIDVSSNGETISDGFGDVEYVGDRVEVRCLLHFNEQVPGVQVPTTQAPCDECGGYPTHRGTCSRSAMRGGAVA